MGMQFGPHSVSHPILSRCSDDNLWLELATSWDRLRAEAEAAVPIFCYPNGQIGDFGDREFAALQKLEFIAAVTGLPGYIEGCGSRNGFESYQLRRYPFSDQLTTVLQYASGFERLKDVVRGATS
jgi:hypothetical protein